MADDEWTTTWQEELEAEMERVGDPGPVLARAPNEAAFAVQFDAGYGGPDGPHVLAWTEQRVYFPVTYDGSESMGSAPRNPVPEGQEHVGGW